jgi:hypothetical protein
VHQELNTHGEIEIKFTVRTVIGSVKAGLVRNAVSGGFDARCHPIAENVTERCLRESPAV